MVLEKFRQLEVNGNSNSQISGLVKRKEEKDKESIHRTLVGYMICAITF